VAERDPRAYEVLIHSEDEDEWGEEPKGLPLRVVREAVEEWRRGLRP
jgi:hypothetical protein